MTYLKTTSMALVLTAVLGTSAAYAGEDNLPSFIALDANADGQVDITEFTAAPGMDAYSTSEITAKFNGISDGADTFSEAQYEIVLMPAPVEDATIVTPENPSDVMGAVETDESYDAEADIEADTGLGLDTELDTADEDFSSDWSEPDTADLDSDVEADIELDTETDIETDIAPEL
eukprot:GHVR01190319.1.p2 GENE.GHVR01190319.1~~GHVR01190319.1.p2  ORF type:complete len:176 (-),score=29.92 GHVR01190319.1:1061-1588(-)